MRAKIRWRDGLWKVWIVVRHGEPNAFELLLDTFTDLKEAHGVARFTVGTGAGA
jgi:hypothetical protein